MEWDGMKVICCRISPLHFGLRSDRELNLGGFWDIMGIFGIGIRRTVLHRYPRHHRQYQNKGLFLYQINGFVHCHFQMGKARGAFPILFKKTQKWHLSNYVLKKQKHVRTDAPIRSTVIVDSS